MHSISETLGNGLKTIEKQHNKVSLIIYSFILPLTSDILTEIICHINTHLLKEIATWVTYFMLLLFSCSDMSNSLQPHGLQHTRLFCPSVSPRVCSNSCPLSQWYQPTISSSVAPFSFCPQSFPASGSFPVSQLFTSGGQSIGASALAQSLQWIFRTDFL